jgi:hypothetical protein
MPISSPPSIADVMNVWSFSSMFQYAFMVMFPAAGIAVVQYEFMYDVVFSLRPKSAMYAVNI